MYLSDLSDYMTTPGMSDLSDYMTQPGMSDLSDYMTTPGMSDLASNWPDRHQMRQIWDLLDFYS